MNTFFLKTFRVLLGICLILIGIMGIKNYKKNVPNFTQSVKFYQDLYKTYSNKHLDLQILSTFSEEMLIFQNFLFVYAGFLTIPGKRIVTSFFAVALIIEYFFVQNIFKEINEGNYSNLKLISIWSSLLLI